MNTTDKIEALRSEMKKLGIQAYLLLGSDPHLSEYVSPRWQTRRWLSGFTGSAGTIVITQKRAAIWSDFRYWIQLEKEVEDSPFQPFRMGSPGVMDHLEWIKSELSEGDVVGVNGWEIPAELGSSWAREISQHSLSLEDCGDLIDRIWMDRPLDSMDDIEDLSEDLSGNPRSNKIEQLRNSIKNNGGRSCIVSSLDELAWLFNVRGNDIPYNPFVRGFALVYTDSIELYTDSSRFSEFLKNELRALNVTLLPYENFEIGLAKIQDGPVLYHPGRTPWAVLHHIPNGIPALAQSKLVAPLQAKKNCTELKAFERAMCEDGRAMIRFSMWMEQLIDKGNYPTEVECADKITALRAEEPNCRGNSFTPITAFGPNGASCHYEAKCEQPILLEDKGVFLLDSGGQYNGATTDITRTFYLGIPTKQFIQHYTLVLKGHIQLAMARFPYGTRGYQLDLLARKPLWDAGLDYGHGTGHGVGAYLSVHEGPQSISPKPIDVPLEKGMVISNEPGYYLEGGYGIRLENLIVVEENQIDGFLKFKTITLCPFERKSVDYELLEESEIQWLKDYHDRVERILTPYLDEKEKLWLKEQCTSW